MTQRDTALKILCDHWAAVSELWFLQLTESVRPLSVLPTKEAKNYLQVLHLIFSCSYSTVHGSTKNR